MKRPIFFVGMHQPSDAKAVNPVMVSINRLEHRVSEFEVGDWLQDSGAFSRISTGKGHLDVGDYAKQIIRWARCGNLLSAVSQH